MGPPQRMLTPVIGTVALGAASIAMEDCGSVPAVVQDASVDSTGPNAHDAQSDASRVGPCGDAGYYITIDGDGIPQTLSSNWGSDVGVPAAYYQPPCDPLFVIAGSANPDGGTLLYFQIGSNESPGPGSAPQGPVTMVYARPDGTYFYSAPGFAQPIYTELGAPGGFVAGSYAVSVVNSAQPDAALSLSGTFCTLRVADGQPQNCPP